MPADGAVLDRAPREIVLTFNEKISPQYAQLIISRDGTAPSIVEPVVTGEVIRSRWRRRTPVTIDWPSRVVSAVGTDTRFPGRATTPTKK
ncbi:MAG: copper resistance protein CopC [Actinomycetales bacterium]|nr:copper resistance protein CopC [Actinomycetales bacterium]